MPHGGGKDAFGWDKVGDGGNLHRVQQASPNRVLVDTARTFF